MFQKLHRVVQGAAWRGMARAPVRQVLRFLSTTRDPSVLVCGSSCEFSVQDTPTGRRALLGYVVLQLAARRSANFSGFRTAATFAFDVLVRFDSGVFLKVFSGYCEWFVSGFFSVYLGDWNECAEVTERVAEAVQDECSRFCCGCRRAFCRR